MPNRAIGYRPWVRRRLAGPEAAQSYLNAALIDSEKAFLIALRNVAEAHQMGKVAAQAGVSREGLYRVLSEQGNPRLDTLRAVLKALGLRIAIAQQERSKRK